MSRLSLRLRLLIFGALATILALGLSTWSLARLFDRHTERVELRDLTNRLGHLASTVERGREGRVQLDAPPRDPLYQRPYSGHYWQIEAGGERLRSRSLWDYELALPEPDGAMSWVGSLPGPAGETLLVLERRLRVVDAAGEMPLRVAVATDRAALDQIRGDFLADLLPYTALLGVMMIGGGVVQVLVGLRPLSTLGQRIAALSAGRARRIGEDVPAEIRPLAREIDSLISRREEELDRARLRAADLAHGLKTPLQALLGEASRLRAGGASPVAAGIEDIVGTMQAHVDRELARARLASGGGRSDPATVAQGVVSVLRRTPQGERVGFSIDVPAGLAVAIDRVDLTELVGALAENATQHAQSEVAITATAEPAGAMVRLRVRDDGPGVDPALLGSLTDRGARLDQRPGSTGLGLSIAAEICRNAGGRLELRNIEGGFDAETILPAAADGAGTAAPAATAGQGGARRARPGRGQRTGLR